MELSDGYASCPSERVVYEFGGKKYIVVRHFTGDKSIDEEVAAYAAERADRETFLRQ